LDPSELFLTVSESGSFLFVFGGLVSSPFLGRALRSLIHTPLPNIRYFISLFRMKVDLKLYIISTERPGRFRFFLEQYQINGGNMDLYVNFSGAGANGFSYSTFDLTNDYFGQLAKNGTVLDNNFHSAFGGSYLNHQWLICGCTPFWSNESYPTQYLNKVTQFDPITNRTIGDAAENFLIWYDPEDNKYYTVNTMHSVNQPVSANPILPQIPTQTAYKTIGDLLSDKGVSWKWYSGGYTAAMSGSASSFFQFHHQPFTYHSRYAATNAPDRLAHLADETDMFNDLAAGGSAIPKVVFYKPRGDVNFHPGTYPILNVQGFLKTDSNALLATSRNWVDTQANLKRVVDSIFNSDVGQTSLVVITFDENGGYWDHVAPPVVDKWGPGTRVPTILLGNYVRPGYVDSTQYETLSVTKFIEQWAGVNGTVVPAGRATNSFNNLLVQPPPMAPRPPQAAAAPKATPVSAQPVVKAPAVPSSATSNVASAVTFVIFWCTIMFTWA
jgi:acid phosphatase